MFVGEISPGEVLVADVPVGDITVGNTVGYQLNCMEMGDSIWF